MVTFRWRLDNPARGSTYQYEVRLDKGINACDAAIEEAFQADARTCLTVSLPAAIYAERSTEFAVRAVDSQGRLFCTAGRTLVPSASGPAPVPCSS
jgi:hypothetical protein